MLARKSRKFAALPVRRVPGPENLGHGQRSTDLGIAFASFSSPLNDQRRDIFHGAVCHRCSYVRRISLTRWQPWTILQLHQLANPTERRGRKVTGLKSRVLYDSGIAA